MKSALSRWRRLAYIFLDLELEYHGLDLRMVVVVDSLLIGNGVAASRLQIVVQDWA